MEMSTDNKKLLSIVVPCYNEEDVIMKFYDAVSDVVFGIEDLDAEFVFIDDGSKDETLPIMRQLSKKDARVRYLSFSRNFGKEAGIYAGLKASRGDYVVLMDADLQHPPKYLPEMYARLLEGHDSVAMKRTDHRGLRGICSRIFFKGLNMMMDGGKIPYGATDYRMMTRQFVDAVLEISEYNRFTKGIFAWVGYDTYWMDYRNEKRAGGKTKWKFKSLVDYSLDGLLAFSVKPLNIASVLGFIMCVLSMIAMLIFVIKTLIWGDPVAGFPTLITVILFIGGLQLFFLGILGRYFAKAYMEIKGRPVYIVKEEGGEKEE